jgi:hypothetical protein
MSWQSAAVQVQTYFGQLNDAERYGWLGVLVGFLCAVSGVVLLFL